MMDATLSLALLLHELHDLQSSCFTTQISRGILNKKKSFVGTKYENKQHNRTSKHMLSYISPQIIATKSEVTCCMIDGLKNLR